MSPEPNTGPRHEPDRIYERASDPAEAADRPLEPKSEPHEFADREVPDKEAEEQDPHHSLNTPVGNPDPVADSDPYRKATPDDDDDPASGVRGSGHRTQDG